MRRYLLLFSVLFFIVAGISLNAQSSRPESAEGTPGLRRQALEINIESRVLENNTVVWKENNHKISMSGNPVGVQLVGSNIVVVVQFTPYTRNTRRSGNGSILAAQGQNGSVLAAQGQIWIADNNNNVTYYTSIQTIPFELGEPIHFLPLGPEHLNPSIEIIITINSYSENGASRTGSNNSQNNK
jgi:hypothetical protein